MLANARTRSRTSSSRSRVTLRATAVVHFGFSEQAEQSFCWPGNRSMALIYIAGAGQPTTRTDIDVALSIETKSARLKVPSERVDLSHTGMCGVILRSTSHLSSLTAP